MLRLLRLVHKLLLFCVGNHCIYVYVCVCVCVCVCVYVCVVCVCLCDYFVCIILMVFDLRQPELCDTVSCLYVNEKDRLRKWTLHRSQPVSALHRD